MADLFKEVIPSILQTKKNVLEDDSDYVPFVVNKSLSFHYDCVMNANQMNLLPNTDAYLQYHYYLNSIRPYKRPYQKWLKRETIEDLDVVKEYYGYSNEKAKQVLTILSPAQLDELKQRINKGGMNNARPKRSNRSEATRTR